MKSAVLMVPAQSLWKLAGVSLLKRTLFRLSREGVISFSLVLPSEEQPLKAGVSKILRKGGYQAEILTEGDFRSREKELSQLPTYSANEVPVDSLPCLIRDRKDLKSASKLFLDQAYRTIRKPSDGYIGSIVNRRISRWISQLIVWTPLSANLISVSVALLGCLAAWLVAQGDYAAVAAGGIVLQISSIVDAVDGEIAYLKLTHSKNGQWVDTVCDNISYAVFLLGTYFGVVKQGSLPYPHLVGLLALIGLALTLGHMIYYLLKYTDSGSLVTVARDLTQDLETQKPNRIFQYLLKIRFTMKRDFFSFFLMVLCLFDLLNVILVLAAFGTNMTWIIIRVMKKEFSVTPQPSPLAPMNGPISGSKGL